MRGILALSLMAATAGSGMAQSPPGGGIFDKAVNRPGIGWSIYGANQSAKQVPAVDVPGGAAVRVQVGRPGANPWDVGAAYPTVKPVAAGDTLLVMVYLRAPEASGADGLPIPIGASEADAPYTPIADQTVKVGNGWKRYYASGIAPRALAAGKARIALQLGGAKQVIEVGPGFLFDLGPDFDAAKLPHN